MLGSKRRTINRIRRGASVVIRELLIRLGVTTDGADQAERKLVGLKQAALGLAAAVASSAAIVGLSRLVDETTKHADELAKLGQSFGVGVEALQRLGHAAELSGVGVAQLRQSLALLVRNAGRAAQGSEQARMKFARLGISVTDASGGMKSTETLFGDVAEAIASTSNPTKQAALAIEIFGEQGARLLPLLKDGRAGIARMGGELDALGAIMSEEFSRDSEKFQDDITRMKASFLGLKVAITKAVLPAFSFIVNGITKSAAAINRLLENTEFLRVGFVVLGAAATALAIKMALPFLPYLLMAALVIGATLAIVAVLEDIWMSFTGGEAVLDRLIEKFMAFSTGSTILDALLLPTKAFVKVLYEALRGVVALGAAMVGNFEPAQKLWEEFKAHTREIDATIGNVVKKIPGVDVLLQSPEERQAGAQGFFQNLATFGGTVGGKDVSSFMGGAPSFGGAAAGAVNVTHAGNTIEVNVNGANGDLAAIGSEVRRQVAESLDTEWDNIHGALVPTVGE